MSADVPKDISSQKQYPEDTSFTISIHSYNRTERFHLLQGIGKGKKRYKEVDLEIIHEHPNIYHAI